MPSAAIERCGNCDSAIGKLERPMVFDSHVVCPSCYARLTAEAARTSETIIVDEVAKIGPKPKPPMFSVDKVDYHAIQRLKLVLFDPDAEQLRSEIVEVSNDFGLTGVVKAVEQSMGVRVRKLAVLQRRWVETGEMSGLMTGLVAVGIYGLLSR